MSRRAVAFWTARAVAGWLGVIAVEIVVLLVGEHDIASWRYVTIAATGTVAFAHIVVMPRWRYRVHRWETTPTAVYTQAGWFTQERRIAPVSRIQTVDIQRGPLEQLFRLANVTITTASAAGPLEIHGLDHATAERIVDELTTSAHTATGDAT
ncbi:MAG TPA: PH domain-containing protein [Jatrophihabitantaceae bacterium]|nr:PH domain-containing protein [Jatrophihabitantaceae bacterium]